MTLFRNPALRGVVLLCAIAVLATLSYQLGYRRGVEAGFLTGSEASQIAQGTAALITLRNLDAGNQDQARADLDALVDAAIAAHWRRLQTPSRYVDYLSPKTELVDHLAAYRRSRPSSAREHTPHLNRAVADYLAQTASATR